MLLVEVGFGSTMTTPPGDIVWTDIAGRVDVAEQGVTINRGASDELAEIQTGTCTLLLDNFDGALSPGVATSPYYPNVRKGTPLRVRVRTGEKNWIPNPGFETGTEHWSPSGSQTIIQSVVRAHDGAASMRISWTAVSSQSVRVTMNNLTPGATYTASAWVWVPAGAQAIRVKSADTATGADIQLGALSTVNDAWQQITVTWTATAASQQLRISPNGTPAAGQQVWVDSVQVEDGASVTAFDPEPIRFHDRFWGAVNDWPTKWRGLHATAMITCSDLFATLARQPQLRSILDEEIFNDGPIAYYPLTEESGATSAGDLSGVTAGPLGIIQQGITGGVLDFSAGPGPAATGEQYPLFTPVSATQGKYLAADLGAEYERLSAGQFNCVEGWFTSSTGSGRVILALESVDQEKQLVFSLSAGGVLQIEHTQSGGTLIVTASTSGNLADGRQHHFVYDEWSTNLWVDGGTPFTTFVDLMYDLRLLTVGAYHNGRLWSGTVSSIALYTTVGPRGPDLINHYTAGMTAFAGEGADTRIARLARYAGVNSLTVFGSIHDPVAGQGAGGSTALSMMQAAATTDGGKLYAERDWIGLAYQGRDVRYNPDPSSETFTVAYADLETADVEVSNDDQKMANIVTATRPNGARQRVIDQASIDLYGPRDDGETTFLKTNDNAVLDAANWLVSRYADPPPEVREVPVEAYTLPQYADILDGDISEYFSITGMPPEAPATDMRLTIEGYTETIKQGSHLIKFRTSLSATDSVWVLNDPVYSVLGTTTRLAY